MRDFFTQHNKVVVVDTEFTAWEGSYERDWSGENEHREIFQVGAVLVDLVHGEVVREFDRFVYPRINPLLSDYVKHLTGISQKQVDQGVDFCVMYRDFMEFSDHMNICSYGRKENECGDGTVFKENIDLYKLDLSYEQHRFINIAPLFKQAGIDTGHYSSGQLHDCFEINVPGKLHDARHDAMSLAVSLIALREDYVAFRGLPHTQRM